MPDVSISFSSYNKEQLNYKIINEDTLYALKQLPDNSYHAALSDPPYGISFMNKSWDYNIPTIDVWKELYRILKPGAHILVFGGTRTFHRNTVNIEDAGFEIRDCISWLYGSGFPKSHNVAKALDKLEGATPTIVGSWKPQGTARPNKGKKGHSAARTSAADASYEPEDAILPITAPTSDLAKLWSGYGTALKPAWEPIIVARKPLVGTIAANVKLHNAGAVNIDGTRIGRAADDISGWSQTGSDASENVAMSGSNTARAAKPDAAKRWPANVILDEIAGTMLDAQSGNRPSTLSGKADPNSTHSNAYSNDGKSSFGAGNSHVYADDGGASRFFYSAKVSKKERNLGCINNHPTLKPISLTTYLAKLILPATNGSILIPYCGTGSEIIGALSAGWKDVVGIELDAGYAEVAAERIVAHLKL